MTRLRPRFPLRRRSGDESGASLVEFALILPVFSLLLFGLVDFGLVFGGYISMENQVNAAGRAISVTNIPSSCSSATSPSLCTAEADIQSSLLGVVPGSVKIAIRFPSGSASAGQLVIVCSQATLKSSTGITSFLLSGKTESARSEIMLEQNAEVATTANGGPNGTNTAGYTC